MSLSSTLSDLSSRFTRQEQFDKLELFVASPAVPDADKARIRTALDKNKKQLEWDSARLGEVRQHYRNLAGSAASMTISFFALSAAVMTAFLQL